MSHFQAISYVIYIMYDIIITQIVPEATSS